MSERLSAEIWIGGAIQPGLVDDLCAAIRAERLSLDWGDAAFEPHDAGELLEGLYALDGAELLHFCDDQSRWGQFAELEEFLRTHGLPYKRRTGGSDCYDGSLAEFRPGQQLTELATNANGRPAADMDTVAKASSLLKLARQSLEQGESVREHLDQAAELLAGLLPPELPLLPPFVIESGDSKAIL